jgi:predicted ABC-type ATPase
MINRDKQIHIISGPNGAGKSSSARVVLLPDWLKANEFVNADEIAKNLCPEDPERSSIEAGRMMVKRMEFLIKEGVDFALETTLSAKMYLRFIERARLNGYKINLIFLKLANDELAQERVLNRVIKGGHNIESNVVSRRFARGLANLRDYIKVVDTATIYEASSLQLIEIARKQDDQFTVINDELWREIENFWQELNYDSR